MKLMPLMEKLLPICRSITGDGFKKSLHILSEGTGIKTIEYPSGQECFEWTVPEEWNIRDAYIIDRKGNKIVDFQKCGLHVVNYSIPFKGKMSFQELKPYLFYLPDKPNAIPYRTSYYKRTWGFCISYEQYLKMEENPAEEYEVCIDSEIKDGVMPLGEWLIPGETDQEILLSTNICHPCMANDNLSNAVVATAVAKEIAKWSKRKFSYRLLVLPATVGCIAYIHNHPGWVEKIYGGYVLSCLGDPGNFTYKKTYQGNHEIDKVMISALKAANVGYEIREFSPIGGDESQYNSPGFRIPIGSLMRTPFMEFPEYHTSLDNLDLVTEEALQGSVQTYLRALRYLEINTKYKVNFKGDPKLSKYNLYVSPTEDYNRFVGTNYFFCMSDGQNSLLDIHEKCGVDMEILYDVAEKACASGLVIRI